MPGSRNRRPWLAAATLLGPLLMWPGLAQPADTGCSSAVTQTDLNECAGQAMQTADADLNVLYRQIQQRLTGRPDTAKLLVASQRQWVAFRDAECKFSASLVVGGSVYPLIYNSCLEQLTRKRISDFKADLVCQEGDMGCPVPAK